MGRPCRCLHGCNCLYGPESLTADINGTNYVMERIYTQFPLGSEIIEYFALVDWGFGATGFVGALCAGNGSRSFSAGIVAPNSSAGGEVLAFALCPEPWFVSEFFLLVIASDDPVVSHRINILITESA